MSGLDSVYSREAMIIYNVVVTYTGMTDQIYCPCWLYHYGDVTHACEIWLSALLHALTYSI